MINKRSQKKRSRRSRRSRHKHYGSGSQNNHSTKSTTPDNKIIYRSGLARYKKVEMEEQLPVKNNVHIYIKNINGRITIIGQKKKVAFIQVIKRSKHKKDLDKVKVISKLDKQELIFRTKYTESNNTNINVDVEYTLKVPYNAVVKFAHVLNGTINVSSIAGPLKLQSINGAIRCIKSKNSVVARLNNGSIKLYVEKLSKDQNINLKTGNGNINMTLPKKILTTFYAHTNIGSVSSNIPTAYESRTLLGKTIKGIIGNEKPNASIKLAARIGSISIKIR